MAWEFIVMIGAKSFGVFLEMWTATNKTTKRMQQQLTTTYFTQRLTFHTHSTQTRKLQAVTH
jgi:hypothetical protein